MKGEIYIIKVVVVIIYYCKLCQIYNFKC